MLPNLYKTLQKKCLFSVFVLVLAAHCRGAKLLSWTQEVYKNLPVAPYSSIVHDGNLTYIAGRDYYFVVNRFERHIKKVEQCANDIQVIENINNTFLLVCGTNIRSPKCMFVNKTTYEVEAENSVGMALPSIVTNNIASGFLHINSTPVLYTALCKVTYCDVYRLPLGVESNIRLLTVSNRLATFRSPVFHDMYISGNESKKVYLFYRELSNYYREENFVNGGLDLNYGMVARICTSDAGGPRARFNFMTLMRARLVCPFVEDGSSNALYYDDLRSTYKIGDVVYGLFILPSFWPFNGTAVCGYDISTIDYYIDGYAFDDNITQYYIPKGKNKLTGPSPKSANRIFLPGQCPGPGQSTKDVSDSYAIWSERHNLIAKAVPPRGNRPYLIENSLFDFILASEAGSYHILYLIRKNGFVKRVRVDANNPDASETMVLQEQKFIEDNVEIVSASMAPKGLIFVSTSSVYQISMSLCANYTRGTTCEDDPYCDWVKEGVDLKCVDAPEGKYVIRKISKPLSPPSDFTHTSAFTLEWISAAGNDRNISYAVVIKTEKERKTIFDEVVFSSILNMTKIVSEGSRYFATVQTIRGESLSNPTELHFKIKLQSPDLKLVSLDDTTATFQWKPVKNAVSYRLDLLQESLNYTVQSQNIGGGNLINNSYFSIFYHMNPNKKFVAKIYALSNEGVESHTVSLPFHTKLKKPVLKLYDIQSHFVVFTWKPVPEAIEYIIKVLEYPIGDEFGTKTIQKDDNVYEEMYRLPWKQLIPNSRYIASILATGENTSSPLFSLTFNTTGDEYLYFWLSVMLLGFLAFVVIFIRVNRGVQNHPIGPSEAAVPGATTSSKVHKNSPVQQPQDCGYDKDGESPSIDSESPTMPSEIL